MTITVLCPQGHIVALDEPIRRAIACPRCGSICAIHARAADADRWSMPAGMSARSERRPSRDDEDDEDDRPRKRKPRDDDDEDEDRPRKRKDDKVQAGPPRKRRPARAPEEEEAEEEEEDDDADVSVRQLTRKQKHYARVRLGILFHMIKLGLMLAAMLFGFITLPLVLFLVAFGGGFFAMLLTQMTYNLGITLGPIVGIVGSILCSFCPPRSEARGTIIVSMIFEVLAPCFGVFQMIMWIAYYGVHDERVLRLSAYMLYARMACTLVAWWLFLIYVRKLAFFMRESLLAAESLNVIVHLLMSAVALPSLTIATLVVAHVFGPGSMAVNVLSLGTLAYLLYFSVTFPLRQFRLLQLMRQRIWDKYLKPEDDD